MLIAIDLLDSRFNFIIKSGDFYEKVEKLLKYWGFFKNF
jgi:hypothetical protein